MRRAGALLAVLALAACAKKPPAPAGPTPEATPRETAAACSLNPAQNGGRPYASLPFASAQSPEALFAAVVAGLRDEGYTICAQRPDQGLLATAPKKVKAGDGSRRVAVAVYLTAAVSGTEGQLWVVANDDAGKVGLDAIARALRQRLVR